MEFPPEVVPEQLPPQLDSIALPVCPVVAEVDMIHGDVPIYTDPKVIKGSDTLPSDSTCCGCTAYSCRLCLKNAGHNIAKFFKTVLIGIGKFLVLIGKALVCVLCFIVCIFLD